MEREEKTQRKREKAEFVGVEAERTPNENKKRLNTLGGKEREHPTET